MYLNSNIQVQERFFDLLHHINENHSLKSLSSFLLNLKKLHTREGDIVEVYGVRDKDEVSLLWWRTDEYGDPIKDHPYMVGGLLYHPHSDEWSVNT
jgi:hypothetical protein